MAAGDFQMQRWPQQSGAAWRGISALLALFWTFFAYAGVWSLICPSVGEAPASERLSALPLSRSAADHQGAEHHAAVCRCPVCPGGKQCCCLKRGAASTPREQALLTARCGDDFPAGSSLAAATKTTLPSLVAMLSPIVIPSATPFFAPPDVVSPSRAAAPLAPPPRLS
ncbi:MAG: hypothetical protein H7Z41_14170 [Cytophagales bacterium]|nr:hypothetical protein [Armatimonadota bacterium]